jgi:hypothetical protein
MPLNTEKMAEYARMALAYKKLKAKATEIYKKMEEMEPALLDHMADNEVDKVSLKGGTVISMREIIRAKYKDRTEAVKALRAAGEDWEWLVNENFNAQSLSSAVRDRVKNGERLPETFTGKIEPEEVRKLTVRKFQ